MKFKRAFPAQVFVGLSFFLFFLIAGSSALLAVSEEKSALADEADAETESPAASPKTSEKVRTQTKEEAVEAKESVAEKRNYISEVEIRGNHIVSTNTVLSKIKSRKGDLLIQETVNDDVKRLYATGFFQDIRMEVEEADEGYVLIIEVIEKPIVRQIILEGFTVFKEDKLRKELKVIEGQILDQKAIKQGVEAVRKLYSDKGFGFIDIQSDVKVNQDTKEAVVTIHIVEGGKFKIKEVTFEGVEAFKTKKLVKLMKTRQKSFPLRSGIFKESLFQKDLERIRLYYQQEGYLDVKVDPIFNYDQKEKQIFIKILVEEGTHYVSGEIKIEGNQLFPESEIWQELEMLPGMTYSQYYLSKDIEKIVSYYHERGYMDARVVPDIRLNRENGKVDITYKIEEGDLYFVEKVMIRGNTKTKDLVIRRELRIRPGERFDGEKIEKSKERLANLDYFEEITYDTEPAAAPNRKDLVFRVKEKRTGELSFGGGVSSVDGFVGFGEISQRNFDLMNWPRFTGGGQSLSVSARVGSIAQDYQINFVEPYLLNKPISFGQSLYNTRRDNEGVDFNESRLGSATTVTKAFRDIFRLGTGYTLERVKLHDISDDAPQTVLNFAGSNWISKWRAIIASVDTRDNIFNPTKGSLITLNGDLAGTFLGGEQDYYMVQTSATKYLSFWKKNLVEFKLRLGAVQELGDSDEVPIFDRFYAGGLGTVRGYGYRRVGPKEAGDAIGGETLAVASMEYTFPVPYMDVLRGAAFVDVGHINPDAYHIDFGDFATSIGPGIKVKTPLGPMAFYYGFPIANRDEKNKNGRFEFSLSRGF
jgi:outer membrane protein insertion porin family